MAMELLVLSKFKLQLLALITEARDLREREHTAREELLLAKQRQKQSEAEYARKLQELHAELASRGEMQRKLENKVKCLENENALLEKKEKELKETIDSLLQSRKNFISHYEDSTCSLRCSIEVKDRKLAVLSENIHAHLLLFDSVKKEATGVKQVLDTVRHLIDDKEKVVTELKGKMDQISTYEKDFVEKIHFLENKVADYWHELRRRDATISELKEHLKADKINKHFHPEIEELQKSLLVKEEVIRNLTFEKKALHFELHSLELTIQQINDTVTKMSAEDQKIMTSVLEGKEFCDMTSREEKGSCISSENTIRSIKRDSPIKDAGVNLDQAAMPMDQECVIANESCKKHVSSCLPEGNHTSLVHRVDSEGSTTGTEALEAGPT